MAISLRALPSLPGPPGGRDPARGGDPVGEGSTLVTFSRLQLTAIIRDRLHDDGIDLTKTPYITESGDCDNEALDELAQRYATDLNIRVRDVTDRLDEFWNLNNGPEPDSPSPKDDKDDGGQNVYGLYSIYGQSNRSVPPPLPNCPPPSSTYAEPLELDPITGKGSPSKTSSHGSSQHGGPEDDGRDLLDEESRRGLPGSLSRFFKTRRSGHKYVYRPYQGDLKASDITMSDDDRIQLMILVKEGKITMNDAVDAVKQYEMSRIPEDSVDGSTSLYSTNQNYVHVAPRACGLCARPEKSDSKQSLLLSLFKRNQRKKMAAGIQGQEVALYEDTGSLNAHQDPLAPNKKYILDSKPPKSPRFFGGSTTLPWKRANKETPPADNTSPSPKEKRKFGFSSPFTRRKGSKDSGTGSGKSSREGSPFRTKDSEHKTRTPLFGRRAGSPSPKGTSASVAKDAGKRKGSLGSAGDSRFYVPLDLSADNGAIVQSSSFEFVGSPRRIPERTPPLPNSRSTPSRDQFSTSPSPCRGSRVGTGASMPLIYDYAEIPQADDDDDDDVIGDVITRSGRHSRTAAAAGGKPHQSWGQGHSPNRLGMSGDYELARPPGVLNGELRYHSSAIVDITPGSSARGGELNHRQVDEGLNHTRSPKRQTPPNGTPPESQSPKRWYCYQEPAAGTSPRSASRTPGRRDTGRASPRAGDCGGGGHSPPGTTDSEAGSHRGSNSTMSVSSESSPTGHRRHGDCQGVSRANGETSTDSGPGVRGCTVAPRPGRRRHPPLTGSGEDQSKLMSDGASQGESDKTTSSMESVHSMHSLHSMHSVHSAPGLHVVSSSSSHSSMGVEDPEGGVSPGLTTPGSAPVVGLARALVDYTPSPFDTDALAHKKGDLIQVLGMTKSGIWRGVLHYQVGTFKFVNIEMVPEQHAKPPMPRQRSLRRSGRHSKRPRPKTVEELLSRLNLLHLVSVFMLNGFETLNLFCELEDEDLDELQVCNPEERAKVLTAAQMLRDTGDDFGFPSSSEHSEANSQSATPNTSRDNLHVMNGKSERHGTSSPDEVTLTRHSGLVVRKQNGSLTDLRPSCHSDYQTSLLPRPKSEERRISSKVDQSAPRVMAVGAVGGACWSATSGGTLKAHRKSLQGDRFSSSSTDPERTFVAAGTQTLGKSKAHDKGDVLNTGDPRNKVATRSDAVTPRGTRLRTFSPSRSQSVNYEQLDHVSLGPSGSPGCSRGGRRPTVPERTVSLSAPALSSSAPSTPSHRRRDPLPVAKPTDKSPGSSREKLVNASSARSPKVKTAQVRHLAGAVSGFGGPRGGVALLGSTPQCYSAPSSPSMIRPPRAAVGRSGAAGTLPPGASPRHVAGCRPRSRPTSGHLPSFLAGQLAEDQLDLTKPPFIDKAGQSYIPPSLIMSYAASLHAEPDEVAIALRTHQARQLQAMEVMLCRQGQKVTSAAHGGQGQHRSLTLKTFLENLGLARYQRLLHSMGVLCPEDMLAVDENQLRTAGMKDPRHLNKLLLAVEALKLGPLATRGRSLVDAARSKSPGVALPGQGHSQGRARSLTPCSSPSGSRRRSSLNKVMDKV